MTAALEAGAAEDKAESPTAIACVWACNVIWAAARARSEERAPVPGSPFPSSSGRT